MSKFLIGSQYFFSCYNDFSSKDVDELEIIETDKFQHMRQLTGNGKCLFQLKRYSSAEEYLNWDLKSSTGMVIGKYLVPEFCQEINFTISDLSKLSPLLAKLDSKHKYEKIIFDSYIENNDFKLTQQQRNQAYHSYKESRGK